MSDITADQVVEAAKALGKDEFNREELAAQMGVDKQEMRPAFREARKAGRLEKTHDDDENTGYFKLT
jgi:transcription initiation factor IIE alpha subunit